MFGIILTMVVINFGPLIRRAYHVCVCLYVIDSKRCRMQSIELELSRSGGLRRVDVYNIFDFYTLWMNSCSS